MIVVFGSINLDLVFSMDALPARGETLLAQSMRTQPGGKGANQAVAAARDGACVAFYGAVGQDEFAADATMGLRADGVDISGVAVVAAPTGVASIVTDREGRNAIAVAAGANLLARQSAIPDVALRGAILLLQMECDPAEMIALIDRAHALGAKTILNLAPAAALPESALRKVDLLVVNESEADFVATTFGSEAKAEQLSIRFETGIVRTLGAAGCEAAVDGRLVVIAGRKIRVVDTTAAGDCFVGVLAAALDRGLALDAALERANAAAALACTKSGSQQSLPQRAEIDSAMNAERRA